MGNLMAFLDPNTAVLFCAAIKGRQIRPWRLGRLARIRGNHQASDQGALSDFSAHEYNVLDFDVIHGVW